MPTAVVLSQGDEIITGQTVDTNASWLSERLVELGFSIPYRLTVGDDREAIVRALHEARHADVVICTGGLGPTQDDLTAEAVTEAFGQPLRLDEAALAILEGQYAAWGREMPLSNRKQVWLPEGCERLLNPIGTAPGFAVVAPPAFVCCMPGVPREMKRMFEEQVRPRLVARFALAPGRLVVLRTTGIGESALQDRIGPYAHPAIVLGYRTMVGENQIKLRALATVSEAELRSEVEAIAARIGSPVFSVEGLGGPGGDLATVVGRALAEQGATLAIAESCTGGRVASLCTAVPGASAWLIEAVVTYANASKVQRLGVPASLITSEGAVSEAVARAMAEGIRSTAGSTYGLAITGIAGPEGGTPTKPVGTVHVALSTPSGTIHRQLTLAGERERIQSLSAFAALDLLRRHLTLPT